MTPENLLLTLNSRLPLNHAPPTNVLLTRVFAASSFKEIFVMGIIRIRTVRAGMAFFSIISTCILLPAIKTSAQNVGIGTTTPQARLHVIDSNVVFSATGDVPFVIGNAPMIGQGRRMMWYADKAAFRVGYVAAANWNKDSIGQYSFAAGLDTKAKGFSSIALGGVTTANGYYSVALGFRTTALTQGSVALGDSTIAAGVTSVAMGGYTKALGDWSTASGGFTEARGQSSFATGARTIAKGYASVVIGSLNDTADVANAYTQTPLDRIFQIGNGSVTRSNALTVLRNGNTGIGTTTPFARLHVADSSVVFSAPGGASSSPGNTPVIGTGRRMMWYADKAAFRAGWVSADYWDKDSTGAYSAAFGASTIAKGPYSFATGAYSVARGNYAVAMGDGSFAGGDAAFAQGMATSSIGTSSVALGRMTSATGDYSTALGFSSTANGSGSTATGWVTTARSFGSFATGMFNDTSDAFTLSLLPTDRIFQIGNGTLSSSRSNAITVFRNGNTGIGTVNPLARLHVADSSVVFSAPGDIVFPVGNPSISGPGRRMMWYADYAAFRAGFVDATQWDKSFIGRYSFAAGYSPLASGDLGCVAMGFYPTASGVVATALGNATVASGHSSTALGHSSNASGLSSTAMGYATMANGDYSTAMGNGTMARAFSSTAIGAGTRAKSYGSLTIGINNDTLDFPNTTLSSALDRIFQVGNGDIVANTRSNALTVLRNGNIGIGTTAPSYPINFADVLGDKISLWGNITNHYGFGIQSSTLQIYTDGSASDIAFGYGSSNAFSETMRIKGNSILQFPNTLSKKIILYAGTTGDANLGVFGNELRISSDYNNADITFGYDNRATSNTELMRLKASNGNLGIGIINPSQKLQVIGNICATGTVGTCSDIRYKKDFIPLTNSLKAVMSLSGFYYHWKQEEFPDMQFTDKRQLGFSAQEVEKLFPEVVMTDANGYKSVDYGRLTPVLVEAIKEQQKNMELQQQNIEKQQQRISDLEKELTELKNAFKKFSHQ